MKSLPALARRMLLTTMLAAPLWIAGCNTFDRVPPPEPPHPPGDLRAVFQPDSNLIRLTWIDSSDVEGGYVACFLCPLDSNRWVVVDSTGPGGTTAVHTGYGYGAPNQYRVIAFNERDNRLRSEAFVTIDLGPQPTPLAGTLPPPSGLAAARTSDSTSYVRLTWTGGPEPPFRIEAQSRLLDLGVDDGWVTRLRDTVTARQTDIWTGYHPADILHYFRLRTVNDSGASSWSDTASCRPGFAVSPFAGLYFGDLYFDFGCGLTIFIPPDDPSRPSKGGADGRIVMWSLHQPIPAILDEHTLPLRANAVNEAKQKVTFDGQGDCFEEVEFFCARLKGNVTTIGMKVKTIPVAGQPHDHLLSIILTTNTPEEWKDRFLSQGLTETAVRPDLPLDELFRINYDRWYLVELSVDGQHGIYSLRVDGVQIADDIGFDSALMIPCRLVER